ncbi:MAG: hypothetical protein ACRD1U_09515 [Vicinamibacterales bacterium]
MTERPGGVTDRSARRLPVLIAALICLSALVASASTRYDPRLRFRTISTPRFDIHFHQGEEAIAARLAGMIEAAAADVDATIGAGVGRVQVILVDQHDLSNGWATPLPYNTIEISVAAPSAGTSLGNTDDWLRLVFVHEYTHIAHLSRAGGWIGGLRRGFGRHPLLFPNMYQATWGIEGLATWQESSATHQGRVPAGDFGQLVRVAAAAGRFEPLDRAAGGNVDWPSGATPYVYGAYFHQYLADRYGAESFRKLADATARRLPYLGSRAFEKVYGRSLGQLWADFDRATTEATRDAPSVANDAVRLTHHGFNVSAPRFGPDGRLFYSLADPHRFPALMEWRSRGEAPRRVADRYLGHRIGVVDDTRLVVDEIDLVRSVAERSDLYLVDTRTGERRRLTHEARALDPDVSPDATVVCAVQMSDRRALATFALPSGNGVVRPQVIVSESNTDFSSPAWSPDGNLIAAERRRLGGPSEIVLVDPAGRSVRALASIARGRAATPAWMPDGRRVVFALAVDGAPFRIYGVDVADGSIHRLEGTGVSAQSPAVSPEGRTLAFVGYTSAGYDLFSLSLREATWTPVRFATAAAAEHPPTAVKEAVDAIASRDYSAVSTLAPQFWTPIAESDGDELVLGAAIGSADALGRHVYGAGFGWSSRARPDWQVAYAYDRWRPTLFASFADDTDPRRGGELRTREADAGILLRVVRVRRSQTAFAAFHVEDNRFACGDCPSASDERGRIASLRAAWDFSNARAFGYSISPEEGGRLSLTAEVPRTAFGSDGNGVATTVDVRRYWRAWLPHGAIAARAAAAVYWGARDTALLFSATGHGPRGAGFDFGRDAIGLVRGFAESEALGTRAVALNVDYRVPLKRIDRGVGTVPVFFRVLHGAVFADAGHAWTSRTRWADARVSIGAEISADAVVGFALPLTVTAGTAWRRDDTGPRGFAVFGRIGRAF